MIDDADLALATQVLESCRARGLTLATAESCTGGLVAAALTAIAGSSDVVERGFVTYSNAAKAELLGVPDAADRRQGRGQCRGRGGDGRGALLRARVGLAVAVTGIAGPGGATPGKPVGLVHFGLARQGAATRTEQRVFAGDRAAVRAQALRLALESAAGRRASCENRIPHAG